RPRSPWESTARWSAVQVVPSGRTSLTLPACSRTKRRPSGAKSMAVGPLSPVTAGAPGKPGGQVVRGRGASSTSTRGRGRRGGASGGVGQGGAWRRDGAGAGTSRQEIRKGSLLMMDPREEVGDVARPASFAAGSPLVTGRSAAAPGAGTAIRRRAGPADSVAPA